MSDENRVGANKRRECYKGRDGYYACLEQFGDDESKCVEQRKAFEHACLASWVKHFDDRRRATKAQVRVANARFSGGK